MTARHFVKGEKVEVYRDDDRCKGLWLPSTVLRAWPGKNKDRIYVEYDTLTAGEKEAKGLREYVNVANVRPLPPLELHSHFKVGDNVDAFQKNGWRKGTVAEILENSKYSVTFDGVSEEVEAEMWSLRLHRDWDDGFWIPPIEHKKKPSELEMKPRELKLRIKFSGRAPELKLIKGTMVEVKSNEKGYQGSWYTAVIVGSVGSDKFLVEYQTLRTDNETEPLQEEADASCIRPCPPEIQRVDCFGQFAEVDAWYNDGWWVGHISKVLDGLKYIVYFKHTKEEMVLEHSKLRPHQEWIDNKWVPASKTQLSELEMKSREVKIKIKCSGTTPEAKFNEKTVVEVKSDEEGYQGSWYTAVIVGSAGNGKLLVDYKMLKTDDESKPLREKADASYIRPCPPEIQRIDRFKMLEEVDAWYNDGWWVGLISKVLDGLKYVVYFWTTNEELEFGHFNLRPHQEWIDGKWVVAFMMQKKPYAFPTKSIGKLKRQDNESTSGSKFADKTKVEVRGSEEDSWTSCYPGIIVGSKGNGKYLVEFQTLKNNDKMRLLNEEVDTLCIRPCPPIIQQSDHFKPAEEVDAWYNNGWLVGSVCKILESSKYLVYIRIVNKVLEFQHHNLRPHQEWMGGKWVVTSRGRNL